MPDFVRDPFNEEDLTDGYVWWIDDAKRDRTKRKRLRQTPDESPQGGVCTAMDHPPTL